MLFQLRRRNTEKIGRVRLLSLATQIKRAVLEGLSLMILDRPSREENGQAPGQLSVLDEFLVGISMLEVTVYCCSCEYESLREVA